MKNLLLCFILLFSIKMTAQTLDDMLSNVDRSAVTSGIIYERVTAFSNLYTFNTKPEWSIANYDYFLQALSEMHRASNKTKFIAAETLKKQIAYTTQNNVVDVGILNTGFQILNYNYKNPSLGGLTYDEGTQKYTQIAGKPAFLNLQATVISPLKNFVIGNKITFQIKNENYFINNSGTKKIESLIANFGDGVYRNIITNGILINQNIRINYTNGGNKTLIFKMIYSDKSTLSTTANLELKYIPLYKTFSGSINNSVPCDDPLKDDFSLTSDYPFQGYDETFAFKGKIDYRVFYHTNNNNTQKRLLKPIIIIDGFDPSDIRKIQPCDYDNYKKDVDRAISDMMTYDVPTPTGNTTKHIIPELRDQGYDVVIVNHPTYCVKTVAPYNFGNYNKTNNTCDAGYKLVNGGADFIERNGLNLVTLIKRINEQTILNGSTDSLVIVGPSMGGQISRYALAYMEKNNLPHKTKLWVSIDSPHLGANIPLGDQSFVYTMSEKENEEAKNFYYNKLSSPAAKQQLINFFQDPSHPVIGVFTFSDTYIVNENNINGQTISQGFPVNKGTSFYQQYYNNLFSNGLPNSKGYPVKTRNIALVNGSLTGSKQTDFKSPYPNDNAMVIDLSAFSHVCEPIWSFSVCYDVLLARINTYFMPGSGQGTKELSMFQEGSNRRYKTFLPNTNYDIRGNMDNIAGGYFDSQSQIVESTTGKRPLEGASWGGSFWEFPMRNFSLWFANRGTDSWDPPVSYPVHSFISTYSALGIKNPNQDWSKPLN